MNKKIGFLALCIVMVAGCKKNNSDSGTGTGTNPPPPNTQHVSVLTQHNDNSRAGLNNQETALTTSNVNSSQFGKLFALPVDDQVYAQPLVVGNLTIGSATHNVVFIATVNNTVYAFDGDSGNPYWKKNFTPAGMRPPNSTDMASGWCNPYTDFFYNIGIVGTPVIDSVAKTMYFVSRSTDGTHFTEYLHAINIVNGNEQPGSPVTISASVPGTGDGNVNGVVNFDPMRNNQRQGLTLVNGVVYVTFSSHCDWNPYHGWILGYNASTLQMVTVYNDTPNGENGGFWSSGQGMVADPQGNLYETTGNGTVGDGNLYQETSNGTGESNANPDPTNLTDRGESALKLTPSGNTLQVSDYFTPTNYVDLNVNDQDYGVMGTLLIPNSNFYFTGAKDGNLYLLNTNSMGGFNSVSNQVQQDIPLSSSLHCQPAYYLGSSNEFVYVCGEYDQLRALSFNRSTNTFASNQIVSPVSGPAGGIGADLSVSSNGTLNGTGIVWASYALSGDASNTVSPGVLRAFDANDITKELWNSTINPADGTGNYAKFCSPTVVDGHVYLATFSGQVLVYGLK
jgi:outer membrane protein assembly factor BamB